MPQSPDFNRLSLRPRLSLFILLGGLLILSPLSFAQAIEPEEDAPQEQAAPPFGAPPSGPPNFTPPPPPRNLRPPPPPPARPTMTEDTPRSEPPSAQEVETSAAVEQRANLVDETDPRMRESVGLIRIPGMGTNEVIEMLENFTRKPILRQQNLPGVNITFFSQQAMTRRDAILAIESLLALNGIAITEVGEQFLKAVPAAVVNNQVAPRWEGTTLNAVPSQKLYEYLIQLDFLSAPEAVQLIQPLMSQGAPIAFDKSNMLLVTDALINLQRLERLLQVIDAPSAVRSEILFYQLNNIPAQEALQRLQQVQAGPLRHQLEGNTTFDADERSNQILVFTHRGNKDLIGNLITRLDIDVAPLTSTRVFTIQHAQAQDVVSLIEQVVSGQKQSRDAAQPAAQRTRPAQAPRAQQQPAQATAQPSGVRGEGAALQFSDLMTLVADERANAIVASGTASDLRFLESLVREIDIVLAQVRIEVIITEVTLTKGYVRGLDAFGITTGVTAGYSVVDGQVAPVITDIGGPNTILRPIFDESSAEISPVILGPGQFSMDLILRQGRTSGNVQVLSAPTIVTTHNREANISIVRRIPIITRQTDRADQIGGGIQQEVQYESVGIELNVTPLIGTNGIVQLEVEQSVSDLLPGTGVAGNPIFTSRSARSYVSMGNGQIVVLGGLQQLNTNESESRVFLLGDIPVLGNIFRRKADNQERTELLIFIRPHIVSNTLEAHIDGQSRLEIIESRDDVQRYLDTGTFRTEEEEKKKADDEGGSTNDDDKHLPARRRYR